ncbi:Nucleoid-associated protein YgaU, contains BON and LysM domains [Enhydrobacter aerosaccus]|uniref:Nucleoid-associated protein YgaU, contains BON and LysM domains n=1 Tax=Enhydrobacter aerosaccus TaxID=225324 RepID=A0A1T4T8U4_9HYPH|nr:LysM peptidoglycan-binding domain-containing protein [Enhydrobacter aerosaccus]SKA36895.1 Nucleoid-associated protein YgaU, contains BON and LysM domains [Enhydrobacter aerosaccus]
MSRTVFALMVVGAAVIAIALGIAWQRKMSDQAVIDRAKGVPPVASQSAPAPPPSPSSETPSPGAAVMAPSFDVARIDPDGRAVIAGRAAPGAKIVLLDGGKEIAKGDADNRGEWVLLLQEPPLTPGQHELRVVQHLEGRAPVTSEQVVVAVVPTPGPGSSDQTLVMIAPPGSAATLIQPPSAIGTPKSRDLQLSTLDYDERGQMTVSGQAAAGAHVRAYIDDRMVGEGTAGKDGHWRLTPEASVVPGKHTLRLDRLGADGKPTARLEVPFERKATGSAAGDNRQLHVVRGDNLWNIARAHYGEGVRFTVIFDANKDQIRDPNLIYPGQVFALPKVN